VPLEGGVIIASNHQSFMDPPLIGLGIPRTACFLARDTLFANRYFAAVIRYLNAFPVKRGAGDVGAFKQALRLLKAGRLIILFPEGTRTDSGRVRPVQPGVIALARKAQVPIVPTAIEGAFDLWPRHARWPRVGIVRVAYGPPIHPEKLEEEPVEQSAEQLTATIRELHNSLRRRAGRSAFHYPTPPPDHGGTAQCMELAEQERRIRTAQATAAGEQEQTNG
jgi:1-acyl-sn-glycerol-3-phosphate acyltransferase